MTTSGTSFETPSLRAPQDEDIGFLGQVLRPRSARMKVSLIQMNSISDKAANIAAAQALIERAVA